VSDVHLTKYKEKLYVFDVYSVTCWAALQTTGLTIAYDYVI